MQPAKPAKKSHWVKIPSKRKIFEWAKLNSWPTTSDGRQSIVPRDPMLLQKLGIEKNARVLVFAGCHGNWARALSENSRVTFTDVSKGMVEKAKRKNPKIESFKVREASLQPRRTGIYDWSFSFEPIPLHDGALQLALVRSLLNRFGAKIVRGGIETNSLIDSALREIAKIYRAPLDEKKCRIKTAYELETYGLGPEEKRFAGESTIVVFTLHSNPQAREKAWQDLRVLNALEKEKSENLNVSVIAKRLGIPKRKALESIARLERIGRKLGAKSQCKALELG
ncbi:MAG: class I SAM-dependent methyltransferase [Candidatus Diapherotrites archaeon]